MSLYRVKRHDGQLIAEVEAETLEEAQEAVNQKLDNLWEHSSHQNEQKITGNVLFLTEDRVLQSTAKGQLHLLKWDVKLPESV